MKNISSKLISMLIIAFLVFAIMPTIAMAVEANDVIILGKADGQKIVYIKDMSSVDFKFAFSDNKDDNPTYTSALKDSNGENVALLDGGKTYKYMFLQKEGEVSILELDSLKMITDEEIKNIETLTKIIGVETTGSESNVSNENGTTVTTTTGKITITDEGNYEYQLLEILDKNGSSKEINQTAVELYDQLSKLASAEAMYDKLLAEITIRDDYAKLIQEAKWEEAKNKEIKQPADSQEGEKFVVLIQEVKDGKTVRKDVQFMTCIREDDADVEVTNTTVTKTVEKKIALPITGENLALYIIFGILIIAIIGLTIRIKLQGKKDEK